MNHFRRHHLHGNDDNHDARYRHNQELDDVCPYDAQHPSEHNVESGDGCEEDAIHVGNVFRGNMEGEIRGYRFPGDEYLHELTDAYESVT